MLIIYVLEKNNTPFYIGKCNNINIRYCQHKKTYGNNIKIKILELVKSSEWKIREKYYISLYESKGFKLKNKNKGGGGPTKLSKKSRLKISKNKFGNNYKLKLIPKGKIEKLYKTNGIYNICKKLDLTYNTVKNYLENKGLYIPNKNRKKDNKITKLKKSEANKGKRSRSIIQYDLDMNKINEFDSATKACISIGKPNRQTDIITVCLKKQKTAFGFIWEYKNKQNDTK